MKYWFATVFTVLLTNLLIAHNCFPAPAVDNFVVITSTYLRPQDYDRVFAAVFQFVLNSAPENSRLVFLDGTTTEQVAGFEIKPVKIGKTNPNSRLRQLQEPMAKLGAWINAQKARTDNSLKGSEAVDYIECMRRITDQTVSSPTAIIIFGSPRYWCPREPSLSMLGDPPSIPSYDTIRGTRYESPYGTAGELRLAHCYVHCCWLDGGIWPTGYRALIDRTRDFLATWASAEGGTLVAFTPEVSGLFEAAARSDLQPLMKEPPSGAPEHFRKATMLVLTRENEESSVQRLLQNAPAIRAGQITTAPVPPQLAGRTGIAIAWQSPCDNDLHVIPHIGAREISFRISRTTDGFLHGDIMRATGGDWEFVELENFDGDWRHVEAWVNCYSGSNLDSNQGKVCVLDGHRAYFGEWRIAAAGGNGGGENDAASRAVSPYWSKLILPRILGLDP